MVTRRTDSGSRPSILHWSTHTTRFSDAARSEGSKVKMHCIIHLSAEVAAVRTGVFQVHFMQIILITIFLL